MPYEIQFITDDRFGGTKEKLEEMDFQLKTTLCRFGGNVTLKEVTGIYQLQFPSEDKERKYSYQWRKTYLIDKLSRVHSWNTVFYNINQIYAPYYKKV